MAAETRRRYAENESRNPSNERRDGNPQQVGDVKMDH